MTRAYLLDGEERASRVSITTEYKKCTDKQ